MSSAPALLPETRPIVAEGDLPATGALLKQAVALGSVATLLGLAGVQRGEAFEFDDTIQPAASTSSDQFWLVFIFVWQRGPGPVERQAVTGLVENEGLAGAL